ncbi:MAG: beta-glucosidase [bacterium]|nr:beta-glucosidase [bacterium]
MSRDFPAGFLWGAATSAYQIEGSPLADGAGPSNWHVFSHEPGRIAGGDTGDVACDHYRRWREDIALMRELGLGAYRFSIAWSRVLPEGTGRVNGPGLDFYDRLVDGLLAAGITPFPTLFHWDLPQALDERGGWAARDCADWFADYARIVAARLGDRVGHWSTLNEPWVVVDGGYVHGVHAPGRRDLAAAAQAAHNLLRGHGLAVRCLRAETRAQVGIVVNLEPKDAASDSETDRAATARADAYMNRWYLDPLRLGRYPDEMPALFGAAWPRFPAEDFAVIGEAIDFLGLNYYTRSVNRADPAAAPTGAAAVRQPGALYTETGWEVRPQSLREVLGWLRSRYGALPIYITENGAAFADPAADTDGRVRDPLRQEYLRTHLLAVRDAIADGVDVRGYFAWSLLDNFEWACGYAKTFGLAQVDGASQRRTVKDSGRFYRDVILSQGRALDG